MRHTQWTAIGLAAFFGVTTAAQAQDSPGSLSGNSQSKSPAQVPFNSPIAGGLGQPQEAASSQATGGEAQVESCACCASSFGPTAPEDVGLLMDSRLGCWLKNNDLRLYGWLDMGYTFSSSGPGLMAVEPRENRFGNEFLVNQLALVLEKPLQQDCFSWGFNATFYSGADAALLQPLGGIDFPPGNDRFSADFRQLYVSAHLPVLTEGGVDLKVGRMGTIIGYESALAPYRPFYSNDYQWFYSQDGAWTGFLTNWHVNPQLDILNGMTYGANTFFTKREDVCYIGQINYWLTEEKKTMLTGSVHAGNQAIFAAPGLAGDMATVLELRVQHEWNECFTQIIQSNNGWDRNVPGIGTGSWYSLYTITVFHLDAEWDFNVRAEWFDDVDGTRTGFDTNYEEITVGLDYHPTKCLSIRPEIRGDFSNNTAAFNNGSDHEQLTLAVDVLWKF